MSNARKIAKLDKRIARLERMIEVAELKAGKSLRSTPGQLRKADAYRKSLDTLRFRRDVFASGGAPVERSA